MAASSPCPHDPGDEGHENSRREEYQDTFISNLDYLFVFYIKGRRPRENKKEKKNPALRAAPKKSTEKSIE